MTPQEEKKIFQQKVAPIMDKIHKSYPNIGMDMYFTAVASELRKQNVQLSNNLVNAIMDKMAKDSMPKGSWDYVSGKVMDNNLIKTVFDWTHPSAKDTPLELEIKRRAELMYKPSGTEKTLASIATATTDIAATAPVAVLCPESVVYGYLIQGGYDIVNNEILLPESADERKQTASQAIGHYNALREKVDVTYVPEWMKQKIGFTDYMTASDGKLRAGKNWGEAQAKQWKSFQDKLAKPGDTINVNGKLFTKNECYAKEMQYRHFANICKNELNTRDEVRKAAEAKAREESKYEHVTLESLGEEDNSAQKTENKGTDPWGQLLNTLGFNGLGKVGKNLGFVLASLPDKIFGVMTGKTKSVGMNGDTLIPLAALFAGKMTNNPMLKIALMGYGGLNLVNKLGTESLNEREKGNGIGNGTVQFRKYEDQELNSRITNLHIEGNRLLADIDKVPCSIILPDSAVQAYQSGALPLNTLANAVLAKNDQMQQQASINYENSQSREQTRGIR